MMTTRTSFEPCKEVAALKSTRQQRLEGNFQSGRLNSGHAPSRVLSGNGGGRRLRPPRAALWPLLTTLSWFVAMTAAQEHLAGRAIRGPQPSPTVGNSFNSRVVNALAVSASDQSSHQPTTGLPSGSLNMQLYESVVDGMPALPTAMRAPTRANQGTTTCWFQSMDTGPSPCPEPASWLTVHRPDSAAACDLVSQSTSCGLCSPGIRQARPSRPPIWLVRRWLALAAQLIFLSASYLVSKHWRRVSAPSVHGAALPTRHIASNDPNTTLSALHVTLPLQPPADGDEAPADLTSNNESRDDTDASHGRDDSGDSEPPAHHHNDDNSSRDDAPSNGHGGDEDGGGHNGDESDDKPFTPPNVPLFIVKRRCARLLMWGLHQLRLPSVWAIIRTTLTADELSAVQKIMAVRQRNGSIRHDIFVRRDYNVNAVLLSLKRQRRRHGWYVRKDTKWRIRMGANWRRRRSTRRMREATTTCAHTATAVASINVNHVQQKRTQLEVYLHDEQVTICGLQETWRMAHSWRLRVSGYQAIERTREATVGANGVALLVADGLQLIEVGSLRSPHFIFARVSGQPLTQPTIFGSVYIPCSGSPHRQEALQQLKVELSHLRHKFTETPLILMGDFNEAARSLDKRLAKFGTDVVRVRGEANSDMRSSHRNGRPGRDIDHIVASAGHCDLMSAPYVDQTWDMSDHWPIRTEMVASSTSAKSPPADGLSDDPQVNCPSDDDERPWTWVHPTRWPDRVNVHSSIPATGQHKPSKSVSLAHYVSRSNRWEVFMEDNCPSDSDSDIDTVEPTAPTVGVEEALALHDDEAEGTNAPSPLPPHNDVHPVHKLVSDFTAVCDNIASEPAVAIRIRKPNRRLEVNMRPRHKVICAIRKARSAYCSWLQHVRDGVEDQVILAPLHKRYQLLKQEAKALVRRSHRAAWHGYVQKSLKEVTNAPKKMWQWAMSISGYRPKKSTLPQWCPVRDPIDGNLVVAAKDITRVMVNHFETLASDTRTESSEHWCSVAGPPATPLKGLMQDVCWGDVVDALRQLKLGKAAGEDGIPAEWYHLLVETVPDGDTKEPPAHPETPMGRALLHVLRSVWNSGEIPEGWQTSVVVPIEKKGDRLNVSNLRGISLMQVALKLLSVIAARNLTQVIAKHRLIRREQAGFRSSEECMAQVTALWEVLQRRKAGKHFSVAVFIDFKSAFDSVPHEALFARL